MIKELAITLFYIILTITSYIISDKLYIKFKWPILNPLLLSSCLIIIILMIFNIPYSTYNKGGVVITSILGPLVVILAIPMYRNRYNLLKNFIPIVGGIIAGILASFVSVIGLCKLFKVDNSIILSLISKSITTPMAIEATNMLGGNSSITIIAVAITGTIGAIIAPMVIKYGKIKSDIAKGIGIGTASHAAGTSKAVEMGEEIGAASGLSIAVTGIITILFIILINKLM
ncbi:MAG: LrgB family protein [Tissierellia bacterium]|nr:LrgB family protein [Tissierellia bacterium]MDD4781532.1 LrgB family protein [Tissierellia bacterium]